MSKDLYWWNQKKDNVHKVVFELVDHLNKTQQMRQQNNLRNMRLYSNMDMVGLSTVRYTQNNTISSSARVKLNIIQSMCDTITAKICKNRPKATFLTDGGSWSDQRRAKMAEKFVSGVFYNTNLYELNPRVFLDSTVFGTGGIKFYIEDNKYKAERVFIDEISVDDADAFYGSPTHMHQRKTVGRDVLTTMYPKKATDIARATKTSDDDMKYQGMVDRVRVVESWHLPTGPEAGDGRHVICVDTCTLVDEEWTLNCFPFVFTKWTERLLGFFGQGLSEQLTGLQAEINKLLRTIQLSMHLNAVPKWLVQKGSGIVKSHINNEIGGIITHKGAPPVLQASNSVPPELREHLEYLITKAYEITGISQLSAQSKKPDGLDSGKAMRTYNDIETERFAMVGKNYEQLVLDESDLIIKMAHDMYKNKKTDFKVMIEDKKMVKDIKWSQADLKPDGFIMKTFPTSFLPETPSGKLAKVEELIQAQFISKEDGMDLLDFPDLEAVTSLSNAGVRELNQVIENMIDDGEYSPPEPFQNLQLGIQKMQKAYIKARMDKVPEDKLELMRTWMMQAEGLLNPPAPPEPPMPPEGMPPGPPMGAPMPAGPPEGMPPGGMPPPPIQ
jgi:hypothetical protein